MNNISEEQIAGYVEATMTNLLVTDQQQEWNELNTESKDITKVLLRMNAKPFLTVLEETTINLLEGIREDNWKRMNTLAAKTRKGIISVDVQVAQQVVKHICR